MRRWLVLGAAAALFGVVLALPLLPGEGRPPMVAVRLFYHLTGQVGPPEVLPVSQLSHLLAFVPLQGGWVDGPSKPCSTCIVLVLRRSLASGQVGAPQVLPVGKDGHLYLSAAGVGYASLGSHAGWTVTNLLRQARHQFPDYAGISLVGMTVNDQVLWTAYPEVNDDHSIRHVFRWEKGTISDLGALAAGMNTAAFNNRGEIAGTDFYALTLPIGVVRVPPSHAYLWQPGKTTMLGLLGRGFGFIAGVNDEGEVAMTGATSTSQKAPRIRALLWQHGKVIDLGTLGGKLSSASAISASGQVIGSSWLASGGVHGFLWQNGKMVDLGSGIPGATYVPEAINDHSQIVGTWTKTKDSGAGRAFLWQSGKITDLHSPAGQLIDSMAINNEGQVIWTTQNGGLVMHGFLWQGGKLTDLGTLNGKPIAVSAINDRGQIVGTNAPDSKPYDKQHAFIWQNGTMTQLPGPAIKAYTMGIDPTGTHVVLGGPCCQKQLLLWTRRG
jgi:probable HAF family extracellular repeat protein